mmetsp:Transcript_34768/g.84006  ORF Transcript_34768/g.84006 Transcript_34768/m.84006 type:complete len:292 (-) Transcript_34768:302-1177(-)|eukprot:CAMPEP_0181101234 /NCGR_PEP_ID=MMETSP1071-20121207/13639_1 /TAXON_ID=35127 /ORGANISM="Thalassiosira sp., Strain NH16" /LENGTH=291 /DNA_ID=CAMNT_0023184059 /DNA_START=53 /DNA_END=928 /DNA_ORIENTATION=+
MTSNDNVGQNTNDAAVGGSGSGPKTARLYADIAIDYNAAKTNPFKRYVEEPTFASAILNTSPSRSLSGQHVLDLGCGAGHYCRIMKEEMCASIVQGVDVSDDMLAEARRREARSPLGIQYTCQDLLDPSADANIRTAFGTPTQVDLVTAEYLLPYAANADELNWLCANAASLVKPGGRFVSIVSMCTDSIVSASRDGLLECEELGWAATWDGEHHDGMCVEMTLFGEARSTRVSFPNYLWTRETIEGALKTAGFTEIGWIPIVAGHDVPDAFRGVTDAINKTPVGIFVANK